MLKKLFSITIIALILPLWAFAALDSRTAEHPPPLQSFPENKGANVNANVNTPGNDYNQSVQEIQNQEPPANLENQNSSPEVLAPPPSALAGSPTSPTFYMLLIIVCAIALFLMFVWVGYRFWKKEK
jgi:hypothetical protein